MITRQQAILLKYGEEIHYGTCRETIGPYGGRRVTIERWRIFGKVKLWKTRPNDFSIPIKNGLYNFGKLTHDNCEAFHLVKNCPIPENPLPVRKLL